MMKHVYRWAACFKHNKRTLIERLLKRKTK